jgi:hypothetical protein
MTWKISSFLLFKKRIFEVTQELRKRALSRTTSESKAITILKSGGKEGKRHRQMTESSSYYTVDIELKRGAKTCG